MGRCYERDYSQNSQNYFFFWEQPHSHYTIPVSLAITTGGQKEPPHAPISVSAANWFNSFVYSNLWDRERSSQDILYYFKYKKQSFQKVFISVLKFLNLKSSMGQFCLALMGFVHKFFDYCLIPAYKEDLLLSKPKIIIHNISIA